MVGKNFRWIFTGSRFDDHMKVIGINGSTRADGNTQEALEIIAGALQRGGIEMEIIPLASKRLNPCLACGKCKNTHRCVQTDDINAIFAQLEAADGIVLASPVYYSNVSSRMAMFIERTGMMANMNQNCLKGKVGAGIAVARRAGTNVVYALLNYYFGIQEMPIATAKYWNNILARDKGDIHRDKEGIEILKNLGANLAEMLRKLRSPPQAGE